MSNRLHIVCLDAPSTPDYGGAIDMFYKIKALAQTGIKIILHYFDYNPLRNANGLETDCIEIYAYKRKGFFSALPVTKPFIVQSRINQELIERLNRDDHPILLEGLHCSGIIPYLKNNNRVVLRMHNDEASYYQHLAKTERAFFKRAYFLWESKMLKRYQKNLPKNIRLAALAQTDLESFRSKYGFEKVAFIPCFIPWQKIESSPGRGSYCLYHGNMQVSENNEAALWLIRNVFTELKAPFIIAGKGISAEIVTAVKELSHVTINNKPSIGEIDLLVKQAHIHVLPSMNKTGVKLKLLNALLNGRFCLTNEAATEGSGIMNGVEILHSPEEWIAAIQRLMQTDFTEKNIEERKAVLEIYNNKKNAEALSALW